MITFTLFDPLRSTLMSYHNFSDDKGGIEIAMGRGASLSYLGRSLKHFAVVLVLVDQKNVTFGISEKGREEG